MTGRSVGLDALITIRNEIGFLANRRHRRRCSRRYRHCRRETHEYVWKMRRRRRVCDYCLCCFCVSLRFVSFHFISFRLLFSFFFCFPFLRTDEDYIEGMLFRLEWILMRNRAIDD